MVRPMPSDLHGKPDATAARGRRRRWFWFLAAAVGVAAVAIAVVVLLQSRRTAARMAADRQLDAMGLLGKHPRRNTVVITAVEPDGITFQPGMRVTARALSLAKTADRLKRVVVAKKVAGVGLLIRSDPQPLALRSLRIDGCEQFSNRTLASFARFSNIKHLVVCTPSLDDNNGSALFHLRRLRSIAVSRARLGPAGIAAICRMRHLREVSIDRDAAMTNVLAGKLLSMPQLTSLCIAHCPVTSAAFHRLAPQPHLKMLLIPGTECDNRCMKYISDDRNLRYLSIDETRIGDRGLHWCRNTRLETVSAIHSRVTAAGAANLYWQNNRRLLNVFITNASVHKGLAVFWNSGDITTWVKPAPKPGPGPPKGLIIRSVTIP